MSNPRGGQFKRGGGRHDAGPDPERTTHEQRSGVLAAAAAVERASRSNRADDELVNLLPEYAFDDDWDGTFEYGGSRWQIEEGDTAVSSLSGSAHVEFDPDGDAWRWRTGTDAEPGTSATLTDALRDAAHAETNEQP